MKTHQKSLSKGFALIATISVLSLLVMVAIGMLSLSSVTTKATEHAIPMQQAKANARMALMIALGELQKAAGPDQRITATASILGESSNAYTSSVTPVDGKRHWAGVWKSDTVAANGSTASYNPKEPDTREFVRWLVSSPDSTMVENLSIVAIQPSSDAIKIFEGNNASGDVIVPKVNISDGSGGLSSYAYWVEDMGVKADLGWSGGESPDETRELHARLSAIAGPDYAVFEGTFDGVVTHPIENDSDLVSNIQKAISEADMPLVTGDSDNQKDWLREKRHDITFGSRGVMTDVKYGGLRRDLSLAFEMDDDAEAAEADKFNQQDGEFVEGNDRLTASGKPSGLPVKERFVYRDYRSASPATPFSSDIASGDAGVTLRGPNWWALRDYANLYKRLSGSEGNYILKSRPHYPNFSSEGSNYSHMFDTVSPWADHWDHEQRTKKQDPFVGSNFYIYRPAQPTYAPVNLGTTALLSLKGIPQGSKVQLAVAVDPIFYIWNPYNRKLQVEGLKIDLQNSFPGKYTIEITGTDSMIINRTVRDLFQWNVNSAGRKASFEVQDTNGSTTITMEPGEVMAVTPSVANSGIAKPGYFEENDINNSGLIMTEINGNGSSVLIDTASVSNNKISFGYSAVGAANTNRYYLNTSIANPLNPAVSEEIQQVHYQLSNTTKDGYQTPGTSADGFIIPGSEVNASVLLSGEKNFFGLLIHLMKPALFGGGKGGPVDSVAEPVEIFSRFNPAPMLMNKDFGFSSSGLNQFFGHISDDNINNLLNNYGFNFTGSGRNAFWGSTYQFGGSTSVPMSNIPSTPLNSLAEFSHANLSVQATEPFHAVGNSWSSPLVTPTTAYQKVQLTAGSNVYTAADHSWLMNDALFDRYYLSGIAPDFTLNGGYSQTGSIEETLTKFYGEDYRDAQANPVLRPYLPAGKSTKDVVAELVADDGYMKMGAYSLIDGVFNVNSTSTQAWEAFLRANRNLAVKYAQGGTDVPSNDTPFPSSVSPSDPAASGGLITQAHWAGFARLDDGEIADLATNIVEQVKLRGPFMSLSDFVNHRMGPLDPATSYTGALQAAIDLTSINEDVQSGAGGTAPDYSSAQAPGRPPLSTLKSSTTNIAGDLTQADLLLPIAPRLTARTDTFRIRSYGEALSADGSRVLASAVCEMVVQRVPEYVDSGNNAADNEPWDQALDPITLAGFSNFNELNKTFGRQFKVMRFRWLSPDEI
ncbi:hypothetical protein ACFPK9_12435 [Rubritalea spongiae]|uniref:Verru_Chthon cassette protein A n=1 Tax=Rubritalea spongiae TaxID=430797 RepID=A0ABW5E318_9BACT